MQMNPDRSTKPQHSRGSEQCTVELNDVERHAIIDFCDAAGEWGSIVPIPAGEADRMIELAHQRRVADLDSTSHMDEDREPSGQGSCRNNELHFEDRRHC
ncbi:hypothetical protein T440DRAFT_53483 [Plenodomus tracheiphilus IPT5]|uniref:Uncharacterized protein n=1 Tax=Plenodomus tracheiphilus IPT5 TaxID=1408161 RepID=A0A6A7B8L1_9PLEO|nr:hypothetical protein T440DRAFT_53483 [Plenodomus tracheiphilus IPT5]